MMLQYYCLRRVIYYLLHYVSVIFDNIFQTTYREQLNSLDLLKSKGHRDEQAGKGSWSDMFWDKK